MGVTTSEGFVPADTVVAAAGTASVRLLAPLGYHLSLDRVVGVLGVTSPRPGVLRGVIYPGKYHCRPTYGGRITIGCKEIDLLADEDTDASTPPAWSSSLLQMAQQDMSGLEDVRLEEVRVGVRPIPGDRLPVIGQVPHVKGAYLAVMHSGVTLAAIVGQTLAEEIITGQTSSLLEAYRPDRSSLTAPRVSPSLRNITRD